MTSELEQAIALVAYGNAVLAGDSAARRGLTLDHPGFVTVISVAFVRGGESVATRPIAWLDHLRRRGARRLVLTRLARRMDWLPEHEAVAFAGGSGVMIAADTRPEPELWAGEWRASFSALHSRETRPAAAQGLRPRRAPAAGRRHARRLRLRRRRLVERSGPGRAPGNVPARRRGLLGATQAATQAAVNAFGVDA